jgi:hypothetical protein
MTCAAISNDYGALVLAGHDIASALDRVYRAAADMAGRGENAATAGANLVTAVELYLNADSHHKATARKDLQKWAVAFRRAEAGNFFG